ncbi:MAG: TIM-barrel domain-containing protein [Marinifilaceae bacterium]
MNKFKLYLLFYALTFLYGIDICAQNPIIIGNARFSFISEGLVRMEYAENQNFLDLPTLFAVNRNVDYNGVTYTTKGDRHIMSTPNMRVEYLNNGSPFGQVTLSVYYKKDGKEHQWKTHSGQHNNLGGSITTLDGIGGEVPLQEGLLSRDGWYRIDDTNKEVLQDGWITPRHRDHVQDLYLFVYDKNYKAALKDLQRISGPAPMPRKYIHGSWYCRWWNYTADEYRQLAQEYKEHNFPLDIIVFDMGWHTQSNAKGGSGHAGTPGWTGYSWNRELIPNPEQLIQDFKKDGIAVVLNEHPHDGIRQHEDSYPEFMKALGKDPKTNINPTFDAGNRQYMEQFMKYAHSESDSMGVAFWWLDWQQDYVYPVVRGTNCKHLPWLNHIYFNYSKQNNLRGAGFSRWAGWGDHRHPIQFSGDAVGNWEMLKFQIKMTATSGNVGCFFWAHDIGGFYNGTNPELYTRWTQFGLLNSSLRIHSVYDEKLDRRPWLWGKEEEKVMRDVYHLRSQLMPYIYTSVRDCNKDMLPLNRAMYIEYPERNEAYNNPQQFMFGSLILSAPITTAANAETKTATQTTWLPENDTWYDFYTTKAYTGGSTITEQYPLSRFPLFVKGGYPIPMQPYTQRMATTPLTQLYVRIYPGKDGCDNNFELYEDDGLTTAYEEGEYATTPMNYTQSGKYSTLTIRPAQGQYKNQPNRRSYRIELPGFANISNIKINGKSVVLKKENGIPYVEHKATPLHKEIKVEWTSNTTT